MIELGILLALVCALIANLAFFLKHRGACAAPSIDARRPLYSAVRLWKSKWFALGMLVAGISWLLHVAALAVAPITVVQIALAAGVVMIGVMADRIFGYKVGVRQWWGLGLTTVGLALIAATFPGGGTHSHFQVTTMAIFEGALLATGCCLIIGLRIGVPQRHHSVMLAAAAGVLFGVSDIAIKALTGIPADHGLVAMLFSPWMFVMLVASVLAFFTSARALQIGAPVPVIAITGTGANVTTVASGIVVFGDPLPASTVGIVVQGIAFLMVIVAATLTPAPNAETRQSVVAGA